MTAANSRVLRRSRRAPIRPRLRRSAAARPGRSVSYRRRPRPRPDRPPPATGHDRALRRAARRALGPAGRRVDTEVVVVIPEAVQGVGSRGSGRQGERAGLPRSDSLLLARREIERRSQADAREPSLPSVMAFWIIRPVGTSAASARCVVLPLALCALPARTAVCAAIRSASGKEQRSDTHRPAGPSRSRRRSKARIDPRDRATDGRSGDREFERRRFDRLPPATSPQRPTRNRAR